MQMTGNSLALDTSFAIRLLNGDPSAAALSAACGDIWIPVTVVGELRFGAINSRNSVANLARIDALVAACRVVDTTLRTASLYAELRLQLKTKGRPIAENDIWIAAACKEMGIPLATDDVHFKFVDGLDLRH
jgi:tRNA(fMet)-specific endonuclease VapC